MESEEENERLKASQPVRCKECKESIKNDNYSWCSVYGILHDNDHYCSYGERRVEE